MPALFQFKPRQCNVSTVSINTFRGFPSFAPFWSSGVPKVKLVPNNHGLNRHMWFNNAQCNSLGTPGKHNLCKWCIRASNKLLLVALRGTIKRGQGKKKSYHHQFDSANPKCKRFLFNQIQKQPSCPEYRPLPSAFLYLSSQLDVRPKQPTKN